MTVTETRRRSFEEVAYLRWHGEPPTPEQLCAQNRAERAARTTAWEMVAAISRQPFADHPLDALRTAVNLLAAHDAANGNPAQAPSHAPALRLFAMLPVVIAMDQRLRNGLGAVAPSDHLGYAANFLYMTFGKVPEPQIVAAFETSLILYTEHSAEAGPLATASTGLYSAVAAAIGGLKNTRHVCAGEAVIAMTNEIAIPDNAKPWLHEALTDGRPIAGFAPRVHDSADSGLTAMRTALGMIAALRRGQGLLEIYDALTAVADDALGLCPNLDYPAGLAYHLIGFDAPAFASIFVAACLPGWTAHIAHR